MITKKLWLMSIMLIVVYQEKEYSVAPATTLENSIVTLQTVLLHHTDCFAIEIPLAPFIPLCSLLDEQTRTFIQQKKVPLLPTQLSSEVTALESLRAQGVGALNIGVPDDATQQAVKKIVQKLIRALHLLRVKMSIIKSPLLIIGERSFLEALLDFFSYVQQECDSLGISLAYEGAIEECEKLVINSQACSEQAQGTSGVFSADTSLIKIILEKMLLWTPYLAIAGTIGGATWYLKNYLEGSLQTDIANERDEGQRNRQELQEEINRRTEQVAAEIITTQQKANENERLLQELLRRFGALETKTGEISTHIHEIEENLTHVCTNVQNLVKEVTSPFTSKFSLFKSPHTSPPLPRKEKKPKKKEKKERRSSVPSTFNALFKKEGPKITISQPPSPSTPSPLSGLRPRRSSSDPFSVVPLQKEKSYEEISEE